MMRKKMIAIRSALMVRRNVHVPPLGFTGAPTAFKHSAESAFGPFFRPSFGQVTASATTRATAPALDLATVASVFDKVITPGQHLGYSATESTLSQYNSAPATPGDGLMPKTYSMAEKLPIVKESSEAERPQPPATKLTLLPVTTPRLDATVAAFVPAGLQSRGPFRPAFGPPCQPPHRGPVIPQPPQQPYLLYWRVPGPQRPPFNPYPPYGYPRPPYQ